jgi:hypothetical protein
MVVNESNSIDGTYIALFHGRFSDKRINVKSSNLKGNHTADMIKTTFIHSFGKWGD